MTSRTLPIKPSTVVKQKTNNIPDAVFEIFNQLIVENFNGQSATVMQKDVMNLIRKKIPNPREAFGKGWLDVEDSYRSAGWKVKYDSPGYNESYEAYFVFSK